MSMNRITGYSYGYTNPCAFNSTYANTNTTAFQGYNTSAMQGAEETQEKNNGINPLLVIGGAIAVVGGIAYTIKRGKTINLAGLTDDVAKQADNLKGIKGAWNNFKTGLESIFTKAGRKEYKYSSELTKATNVLEAARENKLTQEMTEELTQNAAKDKVVRQIKKGEIKLTSITDDAGQKLTGEALENAKKARKEEFARAIEEAKKVITDVDIIYEGMNEESVLVARLNFLRGAKSMLGDIRKGTEISLDDVKELFKNTKILDKVIKDDKVDTETLKTILEKIA